ncbi:unnamed protein product, partial [Prorocentrum cordatum]
MDWALGLVHAAAPLAPYLLPPQCPACNCVADCSVPSEIVGLLGRQLDRCGPEQLTCPGRRTGVFAAGAAFGVLTAALAGAVWRLRWQPRAAAPGLLDSLAAGDDAPASGDTSFAAGQASVIARSLDIPEPQVAVDFFDDPNGFNFHVRVLLVPAGAGKWIWVTPDHSVQFGDLTTHRVVPLPRNAPFPRRLAGQLYAFDPFEDGELEGIREQAAALATVLGIDVPRGAAGAPPRWVVADPAHPQFGTVLDAVISGADDRFVRRGAVALSMLDNDDGEEIFTACENVPEERHQQWLDEKHSGPGRDPRVCPVRRIGAGGPRRATLDQAMEAHRPQDADDRVFRGPKALPEFLASARASGLGIAGYAGHCITNSGIPPGSAAAHEIRLLLEALRHFIEHDQLDVANLAGAELIAGRVVQMQRAIRRDPKHPNYVGLEDMLASALDETGGVVTSKFDEWVAQEQKTKAAIMKNTRIYAEERDAEAKRTAGGSNRGGLLAAKGLSYGGRNFARSFVSKESVLDRVVRSVARHGQPPTDLQPREAFRELLKSSNIYSAEGRLTVRPFDQDKALDLVPDHVRQVLMEPNRFLERHSDELADEPHVEPYWGPLLNPRARANRPRLLALLRRLADMGIVVAPRKKKATVGLFVVEKMGDRPRAIVDGRQPKQFHRLPPQTSMASVEALAAAQVGTDWRQRCSVSSDEAALYAATVDLKGGFHQFKVLPLPEWFVFDMPGVRAMDLGAHQVYDGDAGSFVDVALENDCVWPACGGLAMGWSWAFWICHEKLAHVMRISAGPSDAMVLDKAPAARLRPGMVGDPPCVDNANVIGLEREVAQARLERATKALDLLGLKWHEKQDAGVEVEILGVIVDGVQGLVRPNEASVVRELPTAALQELRIAQSILFMAAGRWGLPACPVAFVTGASMKGRALLETDISADEVHDLCRFRGRARFSRREKFVEREHDGFKGSLAIGDARCGLMGLARAASYVPCHDAELLSARDNLGSVPAFDEKGRAANRELLAQCRRAAALQLASGIAWRQRHVEGARNAADYMSRAADRGLLQPSQGTRWTARVVSTPRAVILNIRVKGRRLLLEIFSGEGYMAGAILEAGLRVGIPMDLQKGPHFDVAEPKVQKVIIRWIRSGAIWLMHLATPCARWSVARSSSTSEPAGGLAAARFTVRRIQECRAGAHFTLENPRRSRLWTWRPLARALKPAGAILVDLCQCRFGTPFQKPTGFAASHPLFATLRRECRCQRRCEVLQGKVFVKGRWGWKTSLAAAYPPSLCRAYADVAQHLAPAAAARPGGDAELERRWERQLAAACGTGCSGGAARGAGTKAGGRAGQARAEPREQAPGLLRRSTVRPATAARYSGCAQELDQFVAGSGGGFADPRAAGATLERCFESLFLGGEAKANARWCLYGLAWQRGWATKGGAFPRAKQALKGWGRLQPPGSRVPAVWEAVLAVADDLIGRDLQSTLAGALLLVAFDGYLRPPEALSLRGADVLRPARSGPQRLRAVTVAPATQPVPSKTNAFDDTVFLGNAAKGQAFVGGIMGILLSRAGQDKPFGGLALARLEAVVKMACRRLQLPVTFTPHCLRHGGASRDAPEKFEDLRSIQRRGRWKARESVRRCEKAGTLPR